MIKSKSKIVLVNKSFCIKAEIISQSIFTKLTLSSSLTKFPCISAILLSLSSKHLPKVNPFLYVPWTFLLLTGFVKDTLAYPLKGFPLLSLPSLIYKTFQNNVCGIYFTSFFDFNRLINDITFFQIENIYLYIIVPSKINVAAVRYNCKYWGSFWFVFCIQN